MHPKLLESTIAQCSAYMLAGDCHGEAPPLERLVNAVVDLAANMRAADEKLTRIAVGGCTCGCKTPELRWHDVDCHYRLASEAAALLSVAHGVQQPNGEQHG